MNLQEVFVLAKKHNVQLWLDNGQLRYRAPKESLSPELLQIFKQQRELLIHALSREAGSVASLFPLSYNQQSLWILHTMMPHSSAYTVAAACRIRGPVSRRELQRALEAVVRRHEALRTTYGEWPDGSGPCQYLHDGLEPWFSQIDAQGWSDAAVRENITRCLQEPFDLAHGPLLRTYLFSRSAHEHLLLLAVHHIACDGTSLGIYVEEVIKACSAPGQGRPLEPAAASRDYRDFILMQKELLGSQRGGELLRYWQEALAGMPDTLDLPTDFAYPAMQQLRGASVFFEIGKEQYQSIKASVRGAGVTTGGFMLACFALTLMRLSGQFDFGIAVAASGRTRPEYASICGYLVNPVVIRCRLEPASTGTLFLREISQRLLEALDHQDYPFSLLVEKLAPPRRQGRQPLAQVLFNFVSCQSLGIMQYFLCPSRVHDPLQAGPLHLTPYVLAQQEGQYELALDCIDENNGLFCTLKYSTDIFSAATAEALAGAYQSTLAELCAGAEAVLCPVLPGRTRAGHAAGTAAVRQAKGPGQQVPAAQAEAVLDLPADRPRMAGVLPGLTGQEQIRLKERALKKIQDFSMRSGCHWQTTACAACAALLERLTGCAQISFAVTGQEAMDSVLLPALEIDAGAAFGDFVQTVKKALSDAAPQPAGSAATVLFFREGAALQDCAGSSACELAVGSLQAGRELELRCRYQTRLFDAETIREWLSSWALLLQAGASRPELKLWQLPVMSKQLKDKILYRWNDTDIRFAPAKNLTALLDRQVARTPWAEALRMEAHSLSFTELALRASALAAVLQQHGVGPDSPVGICAWRSVEMVIGLVAVLKAGGAYMPLDPALPKSRLATMLAESRPPVILVQPACRESLPDQQGACIIELDGPEAGAADKKQPLLPAAVRLTGDNLAYVIFTSGSTGKPKGVMNTHGGICNRLLWMQQQYQLTAADRVLQKTPFGFDVSVWEFFWPLMAGASLVVSPPGAHRDPAAIKKLIQDERISIIHFVPSMLRLFLDDETPADLSSLRHVICSGEALPADLQKLFFRRMPESARLHNLYGPTEAAVDVSYWECRRDDERSFVPIGRPIANTRLYILDSHMQPVLPGVAGELYIGGAGLARGYINNQALTDEAFIANPFSAAPRQRLYKTGDRARYVRDGSIDFLGRLDRQVKLRGCRIELGELEAVLRRHGGVHDAAAAVCRDTEGLERLVAYVVPHRTSQLSAEALREFLRQQVPEYMVPDYFMLLGELPLSANGKIDRRKLCAPDWSRPDSAAEFVLPRGGTEHQIAGVWKKVLKVDKVGAQDNFFDLGGNSLLLVRACRELEKETGREISLNTLFQYTSVAALAAHLDARRPASVVERAVQLAQRQHAAAMNQRLKNLHG